MVIFRPVNIDPIRRSNEFEYVCPKCKGTIKISFFSESGKRWLYNVDSKEEMESVKEIFETFICPLCRKIKK